MHNDVVSNNNNRVEIMAKNNVERGLFKCGTIGLRLFVLDDGVVRVASRIAVAMWTPGSSSRGQAMPAWCNDGRRIAPVWPG